MNSKGVLIFANNNGNFDYLKMAYTNSLMIQKNLEIKNISIVTDSKTLNHGYDTIGKEEISRNFDQIILSDEILDNKNLKLYRDTCLDNKQLPFFNKHRWQAYSLSPYEETLLLDADYFIMGSVLNNVWDSHFDVMINKSFKNLMFKSKDDDLDNVSDFGIPMYWATAVYFRKSNVAESLFNIVRHISKNYAYYRYLHGIDSLMFRNDFAFSMAIHMLNGFSNNDPFSSGISELPINSIYKALDTSDIHSVNGVNDLTLLLAKTDNTSKFILTRVKDIDIHIMNKWAIQRNLDKLIEVYK